jgi:2-iminobutanoate/2-iminopropanoate deaminase
MITGRLAAPVGAPFSDAVLVNGPIAFLAGQGPLRDGQAVLGTHAEQVRLTLANLDACLSRLGADRSAVVSCTCYLADLAELDSFNAVYVEYFGLHRPARTTVQARLIGGIGVEVTAVVALPPPASAARVDGLTS